MQTIYILWLRQLKRYFRSKSRMIGALGQPVLYLVALNFGFGSIFRQAGQGNYIQFLAPGVVGMTILFTSIFSGMEIIWDRQFGFLKETLVAPVSRLSIMLGRTLGSATVATMQGLLVLLITFAIGFRLESPMMLIPAIGVMALTALLLTSFGTAMGAVLQDMQGFQLIMNFIVMPMFFLSGSLFPLGNFPMVLQVVAAFDPLSYGIDALRATLINVSHFGLSVDLLALSGITIIFLGVGSYLFNKIQV
jgi:ABC-2 type transport system permease protein